MTEGIATILLLALLVFGVSASFKHLSQITEYEKVCLEAKYKNYTLENCEALNDDQQQ